MMLVLLCSALVAKELKPITLQLSWKYQFQFAGFIVAKEKGYYEEMGLDVTLREYDANTDNLKELLSKKTEYAVFNSQLIYRNKEIQKLRLLSSYLQRNPLVFIAQPDIKNPSDLVHKRIMGTNDNLNTSALVQMLDHFFINADNAIYTRQTFSLNEFIDKKIDAMSVFRSNELYELDKRNIAYSILDPYDYGFFTSAINLFTSDAYAEANTEEVKQFIAATNKGWKYALENMTEVVSLIHTKYRPAKSLDVLTYEAKTTNDLMLRNLYDIGEVNKEQVLRQYKQLIKKDFLLPSQNIDHFFFDTLLDQSPLFSSLELDHLNRQKTLSYCVSKNTFDTALYKGIENDYIHLFSKKLKMKPQIVYTKNIDQSMAYIKKRKCDVLPMMMKSQNAFASLAYTSPYLSFPLALATLNKERYVSDIYAILNKPLGVIKQSPFIDRLKMHYPAINLIEIDSMKEGIKKMQKGELFAVVNRNINVQSILLVPPLLRWNE